MNIDSLVEKYNEDIIKSTQEIIGIKSVEGKAKEDMPFGEGPYRALEYTLNLADTMGFKTKNLNSYAGYAEFGEGEETLGILVHLDVVPEGDGWDYNPYGGEIHNGRLYGRGAIDDKGPAMAVLYAMKIIKDIGVPLNKKIRIIFGTNEETGWGCMNYYLKNENPPDMAFTPDADFPVIHAEMGILVFDLTMKLEDSCLGDISIKDISGGNAVNMVPDRCEAILKAKNPLDVKKKLEEFVKRTGYNISFEEHRDDIKISSRGIQAHGSTPQRGQNAISQLTTFLGEILECNCDICNFIKFYNEKIAFEHYGEKIGCGFEDEVSGKLIFNPGVISMENNNITLKTNIRYPISCTGEEVYRGIRGKLKGTKIKLIEIENKLPLYVPKNHFLVQKLMKVYRDETGDLESEPIVTSGGTYARAFKNAVAFGPVLPGQELVEHQRNEYIEVSHLLRITNIYAKALYELAK